MKDEEALTRSKKRPQREGGTWQAKAEHGQGTRQGQVAKCGKGGAGLHEVEAVPAQGGPGMEQAQLSH